MEKINLVNVQDIEELILAKYFIETDQIKNNIIKSKVTYDQFIMNLELQNSIYYNNGSIISFKIINANNTYYIFYIIDPNLTDKHLNILIKSLEKMNFDINNAKEMDMGYRINENPSEYLIINSKMCYI